MHIPESEAKSKADHGKAKSQNSLAHNSQYHNAVTALCIEPPLGQHLHQEKAEAGNALK